MTSRRLRSWRLWAMLPLVGALMWGASEARPGQAGAPPESVELSIQVDGPGGPRCTTQPGDSTLCRVPVGERFEVGVNLDDSVLQDFDMDTVGSYVAISPELDWSNDLTVKPRLVNNYIVWPDCGFVGVLVTPHHALLVCAIGLGSPNSNYLGRIAEVELTCTPSVSSGHSVTMPHLGAPAGYGDISDENNQVVTDDDPPEALTINCLFIWDVNGDNVVSGGDIATVVSRYGQTVPPAAVEVDVDGGGIVSAGDIAQEVAHYGQMAPP